MYNQTDEKNYSHNYHSVVRLYECHSVSLRVAATTSIVVVSSNSSSNNSKSREEFC
ncbi:unnamed protein product [Brugia timori]|uniref:Uncharacterized protein n=1 Tax=Brugia timori TaxID=42155 RepID=A0A0R3R3Z6_9BILA|nr:unnamed protein product [Brugia timori]